MNTTRRSLLIVSGSALLAGCSDTIPRTGPEYESEDEVPPFPDDTLDGEGWVSEDSDEADQMYIRYDGDTEEEGIFILDGVAEDTDEATERIDEIFLGIQREEFDLADEAYWGDDDQWGYAGFRHSNAWATVGAISRSGFELVPDTRKAINLTERWFENW